MVLPVVDVLCQRYSIVKGLSCRYVHGGDCRMINGRQRVVIERITPQVEGGRFPAKRVLGETFTVEADLFADGHEQVTAYLLYRSPGEVNWKKVSMEPLGNDRWKGSFVLDKQGPWSYTISGWVDTFLTWQKDLRKRLHEKQDISQEILIGVEIIESARSLANEEEANILNGWCRSILNEDDPLRAARIALSSELSSQMSQYVEEDRVSFAERKLSLEVEREKAGFSTWYEVFPRSWSSGERHGTFRDLESHIPEIAAMGFDVLYLTPIHPIGVTSRKGRNNAVKAEPDSPGSPWAIGSAEGGHYSIHPELGGMDDLKSLISTAGTHGLELALDMAFQCSPDHPYVKEHPEWFRWRPDGTIQYAENPPKKYEDIVPFDFECPDWEKLWKELRNIVFFWIDKGIRIFRVDNPHTKPFAFWEWLISSVREEYPDVIFLSEAFTRPKVMARLAKAGFSQSYTYFTWRNTKTELIDYLEELTGKDMRDYFRPNFWPNTPDILPQYLQFGGRPAFVSRLVLAATLSSCYGIYGPVYDLCVSEGLEDREEYHFSEKYEIKKWDLKGSSHIRDLIARINRIRRENRALQNAFNLKFYQVDNDQILFYEKKTDDLSNVILVAVNLDPFRRQTGTVRVPIDELGIGAGDPYMLHDLIGDERCLWKGEYNAVDLDPEVLPVRIYLLQPSLRRESDFDYFM